MVLREYQKKSVTDLREAFKRYKSICYTLPTGGGKTAIFSFITSRISESNRSVYILVHREELLLQASKKLAEFNIPHGRLSPAFSQTRDKIQVCSVQTLVNRLKYFPEPDLIIIDECHHAVSSSYKKILDFYPNSKILGVTATPERMDGRGLSEIFQILITGPTIQELTDYNFLSPSKVFAPQQIDFSSVKIIQGDYSKGEISNLIDTPTITGNAIQQYLKFASGKHGIVFCCSIKHANDVANDFNSAGIPAKCIDGTLDRYTRKRIIEGLGIDYKILTSCDIVSEGTDIPSIEVAILLRPTLSLGLYLQQVGRCLRTYPGKEHAIILDHVGNVFRHGLPDENRDWNIDSVKRTKKNIEKQIPIRQCKTCYTVYRPNLRFCPNCNSIAEVEERTPEMVDGELEEIQQIEKLEKRKAISQAKSLQQLQEVAKKFGYKPGWAYHIYNARKNGTEK
jgi:superfamily II DNA or RNA helicase